MHYFLKPFSYWNYKLQMLSNTLPSADKRLLSSAHSGLDLKLKMRLIMQWKIRSFRSLFEEWFPNRQNDVYRKYKKKFSFFIYFDFPESHSFCQTYRQSEKSCVISISSPEEFSSLRNIIIVQILIQIKIILIFKSSWN